MGQQQLLLLVLATVIVGLATVAGIQAFDQNQSQAANDALTQKALSIASDIQAQASKPEQLGGIDLSDLPDSSPATKVANAIGLNGNTGIKAGGAGDGATCKIQTAGTASSSDFSKGVDVTCSGGNATTNVTANVQDNSGDPEIDTQYGSGSV